MTDFVFWACAWVLYVTFVVRALAWPKYGHILPVFLAWPLLQIVLLVTRPFERPLEEVYAEILARHEWPFDSEWKS